MKLFSLLLCASSLAVLSDVNAQITSNTHKLRLVGPNRSIVLVPPSQGTGDIEVQFPDVLPNAAFVTTNTADPLGQSITGGLTLSNWIELASGTAFRINGDAGSDGYVLGKSGGQFGWLSLAAASLPAGAINNTFRHNGTEWVASTALTNDGTDIAMSGALNVTGAVTAASFVGNLTGVADNAMQLDGNAASAFAQASHSHSATDLTSGTIADALLADVFAGGSFTNANITVDAKGRITAASNGSGGGGTVSRGPSLTGDGSAGTPLEINLANSNTFTAAQLLPADATQGNNLLLALNAADAGSLSVARGGTGQSSYTNGQLLIGNSTGNTLTKSTLTAGAGVTITNGTGTITIASAPIIISGAVSGTFGTTTYHHPGTLTQATNTNIDIAKLRSPRSGVVRNFYVDLTIEPGDLKSRTFSVENVTAGTSLNLTIQNTDKSGASASTMTVSAGDVLRIKQVASNSPASSGAVWTFEIN